MPRTISSLITILLSLLIIACGSEDNSLISPDGRNRTVDSKVLTKQSPHRQIVKITGKLTTFNSSFGIADANVFVTPVRYMISNTADHAPTNCENTKLDNNNTMCSNNEGAFEFYLANGETYKLTAFKNGMHNTVNIDLTKNTQTHIHIGNVSLELLENAGNTIAVVSGHTERMEDVLAKSGYGEINEQGKLILGSEQFDLYDRDNKLGEAYPEFVRLFDINNTTGTARIFNYDMVFINSDADEFLVSENMSTENITMIRQFIEQGGKLYTSDSAYDFIDQTFPDYFNIRNENLDETPEAVDRAQDDYDNDSA